MSHTLETQLEQNPHQTFFKPQNLWANFLFIFGLIRTDQKFGGNSGPTWQRRHKLHQFFGTNTKESIRIEGYKRAY